MHLWCAAAGSFASRRTLLALKPGKQPLAWAADEILHHRVDSSLTHIALRIRNLLPIKPDGILIKVELEGHVRWVACP